MSASGRWEEWWAFVVASSQGVVAEGQLECDIVIEGSGWSASGSRSRWGEGTGALPSLVSRQRWEDVGVGVVLVASSCPWCRQRRDRVCEGQGVDTGASHWHRVSAGRGLSCWWKRKGRERVQTCRYGRYSMGTRVIISQPVPVPPTHDGLPVPVQICSDGTLSCRQPQVIVIGGKARVRARRRQGESRREGANGQSTS